MKQYRLTKKEMESLTCTKQTSRRYLPGQGNPDMHLYQERDVERRAREKHGGPSGLKSKLDELYDLHVAKQAQKSADKRTTFTAPQWYSRESASNPSSSTSILPVPMDIWAMTPALQELKKRFPEWLWTAVNKHLDHEENKHPDGSGYFLSPPRSKAVKAALKELKYPDRPTELERLPSSPSFNALREVLHRGRRDVVREYENQEGDKSFSWQLSFVRDLFPALEAVVREHGTDKHGWETIRWEVYDAFADAAMSVEYTEDIGWADHAVRWLVGQTSGSTKQRLRAMWGDDRLAVHLSKAYDAMLPRTDEYGRIEP
ncbi:hypothetical protein EXIGLDRAFT_110851 [Exidia glandulosa HHB12029]|uniref:Uncharacterized protein n=1 Tax=Exidia glandulosa HHB12029 TaxID=1314781 RepID=A0A166ADD5_EXIGL|nr:hypothetical protein EXIGLDRAFT_110851 [Exidia glandulosa HHB12029]